VKAGPRSDEVIDEVANKAADSPPWLTNAAPTPCRDSCQTRAIHQSDADQTQAAPALPQLMQRSHGLR
jgi:hypothetical protein